MKRKNLLLIISILLFPIFTFATNDDSFPLSAAILMEAFVSIHMSIFVLLPLSKIISPNDSKKTFWKLFEIRAGILLFFDLFITPYIAIIDFISVFIGAFLVLPFNIKKIATVSINNNDLTQIQSNNNAQSNSNTKKAITLKCAKCGGVMQVTDKFCTNCGTPFDNNNVVVKEEEKRIVNYNQFDPIYSYPEEQLLTEFIKKEMAKADIKETSLIPSKALKKKIIMDIFFSILLFVYICSIFFHFPIYTYIIGAILLIIYAFLNKKFKLISYLIKEIKARPSEKISNIVMSTKTSMIKDNSIIIKIISFIIAITIPCIIFRNPIILYEPIKDGYAVRFYAFGLTNNKTAIIPEEYKGKKVTSLRGNTFSNMPNLEKVTLPDTITEIRGQAFKNDKKLKEVNIPLKLEYLGGGAFYNCQSIEEIYLPDTLTYMGGETFYNASSLYSIHLSEQLPEIRGDTFEECTSLKRIEIPDSVTRIGGHAFYGDSSLSEVIFTPNSSLKEIGSSAFRSCYSLTTITLPNNGLYINERAFKNSPTVIHYFGEMTYEQQ